jgi:hypothetical protein
MASCQVLIALASLHAPGRDARRAAPRDAVVLSAAQLRDLNKRDLRPYGGAIRRDGSVHVMCQYPWPPMISGDVSLTVEEEGFLSSSEFFLQR